MVSVHRPAPLAPADLPELVSRLDAEFIGGRGRSVSLAARFPLLFDARNAGNIWTIRDAGCLAAALVIRRFTWIDGKRDYRAAMIGMVWTEQAQRGKGLASGLLEHAAKVLKSDTDFAVLWTAQPDFYARLGWVRGDNASFGEINGSDRARSGEPVAFERVRGLWEAQARRAVRGPDWNPPLPLPATSLEMFVADKAYAIAGRLGDKLYCHELCGDATDFPLVLDRLRESCKTLCFNERSGSAACVWLAQSGVAWQTKPLAMWLPLRDGSGVDAARDWYVPWLDRI
jgi:GNAT superfamily N-acetyltransferase